MRPSRRRDPGARTYSLTHAPPPLVVPPLAIALGARLGPSLRMEAGYLNRAAVDDWRVHTRDHALQVAFVSSAPLLAGRRRPAS